jgi:hypothetical protein
MTRQQTGAIAAAAFSKIGDQTGSTLARPLLAKVKIAPRPIMPAAYPLIDFELATGGTLDAV